MPEFSKDAERGVGEGLMERTIEIDARGLSCPQPVLLTKKSIESSGSDRYLVIVDNTISRENVCRFLTNQGFESKVRELSPEHYEIEAFRTEGSTPVTIPGTIICESSESPSESKLVVYVGSCFMGSGDDELGRKLIRGFLRTLIDMNFTPWRMIFINSGVKLTTLDDEATEAIGMLIDKGVEVLSCGTCLNHYQVEDKLVVGRTTTMYEVIESLEKATKVISPD